MRRALEKFSPKSRERKGERRTFGIQWNAKSVNSHPINVKNSRFLSAHPVQIDTRPKEWKAAIKSTRLYTVRIWETYVNKGFQAK